MATLKFLDPRATVNPKDRPLVSGLDTLEGKVIGIIDNGQSNSTDMFKELATADRSTVSRQGSVVPHQADAYAGRAQTDHGGTAEPM